MDALFQVHVYLGNANGNELRNLTAIVALKTVEWKTIRYPFAMDENRNSRIHQISLRYGITHPYVNVHSMISMQS